VHWISPSDAGAYADLLSHISGNGSMDDLKRAIGGVSPPHLNSLVMHQATFAVVSYCGSSNIHIYYHGELHGEAWTAICH
jgi:hypothetical protein